MSDATTAATTPQGATPNHQTPSATAAPEQRAENPNTLTLTQTQLDELIGRAANEGATRALEQLQSRPRAEVGDDLARARMPASDPEADPEGQLRGEMSTPRVVLEIAKRGARNDAERNCVVNEYLRHTLLGRWYDRRSMVPFETLVRSISGDRDYVRDLAVRGLGPRDLVERALSTAGTGSGAELVATQYVREIMVRRNFVANFRQFVDVITMTENALDLGAISPSDSAHYKGEAVAVADENLKDNTTDNRVLVAKTLIAMTKQWSRELWADSRTNVALFLARDIGRDIARKETSVFTIGNSATTPLGLHATTGGNPYFDFIDQAGNETTYRDITRLRLELPEEFLFESDGAGGDNTAERQDNFAPMFFASKIGFQILENIMDGNEQPYFKPATATVRFPTFAGYRIGLLPNIPGAGTPEDPTHLWWGSPRDAMLWGDRQELELESTMEGPNFSAHTVQVKGTVRHDGRPNDTRAMKRMRIWSAALADES